MPDHVLAGKKIAVLVESQYIPAEIRCYQERFASEGAEVHLMSNLWGQEKLTFVGELEVPDRSPETLDVDIDVSKVDVRDYAAVIMAANYTSVRLRWNEESATATNPMAAARDAPAVRFFRNAMRDPRIVKGAPCHGLWILAPSADYLSGRRVTCNPVVLADVLNAGATYVPAPPGEDWWTHVVVDGDLVTSMSAVHEERPIGTERFVDAVRDRILAVAATPTEPAAAATASQATASGARLHHVSLTCDDMAAVERFYVKHFGFRRVRVVPTGDGQIVFLRGAGTLLELFRAGQRSPLKPAENDGYPWAGVRNFSMEVDSVEQTLTDMGQEASVTFGPLDFGEVIPGWRSAWLRDPAGNIVQITQGYVDQENPPPLEE